MSSGIRPQNAWWGEMLAASVSHLVLDIPTLFAVTLFITVIAGLLLLFAFLQNRNTPALALWGIGYLVGTAGAALVAGQTSVQSTLAACIANGMLCAAYGFMWCGARSFEGRRVSLIGLALGPVLGMGAFAFDGFAQSMPERISLVAAISASYALLAACELWYARDRDLISRWPTLLLVVTHAAFLLARIPYAEDLASSVTSGHPYGVVATVMAFEALFAAFCVPFLRVAMSKERAELEQRRAAETDPLTGAPNRRAFFDRGEPLLERFVAERQPAALLLFDLDRFKAINDTAGHQGGDQVLQSFCDLVSASLGPRDLFGRLGGEEFAFVMVNASMTQALQTAERLRGEFAALQFGGLSIRPTVSVGVAVASESGRSLSALLALADRALYRAKAEGRNRVMSAPPILVEINGRDLPHRAAGRPAAVSAPIAR
jgi:diguanylate cyclase (GGDEF)-like protein